MEVTEASASEGMSEAERRRAERRRKILASPADRYKKILGPNADIPQKLIPPVFLADADEPVLPEEHLTREFLSNAQRQSSSRQNGVGGSGSPASSVPMSQSQIWKHRTLLSLLGLSLPFLGLNYFLLYFVAWEVGMVGLAGGIPFPPSQPNILLTLVMVMGLKEQDVRRLKLFIRISKWLCIDFCFFFMSTIVPQVGLRLLGLDQPLDPTQ